MPRRELPKDDFIHGSSKEFTFVPDSLSSKVRPDSEFRWNRDTVGCPCVLDDSTDVYVTERTVVAPPTSHMNGWESASKRSRTSWS